MKKIGVAILGLGSVGGSVYRILTTHREFYQKTQGVDIEVVSVLEKERSRVEKLSVPEEKIASNIAEVVCNPDVNLVVECIGGVEAAKEYALAAFNIGKSVVTGNLELYAKYADELERVAKRHNAGLFYGASCMGGIPAVRLLLDGVTGDGICSVVGTVSEEESAKYQLAVLSSLAFNTKVSYESVKSEPLDSVSHQDKKSGCSLGFCLKPLFSGKKCESGISAGVYPALVKKTHPLGSCDNALLVKGESMGEVVMCGGEADFSSYASGLVSDVIYAATHTEIKYSTYAQEPAKGGFTEDDFSAYYLRLSANEAGALAKISSALDKNHIDVVQMQQCKGSIVLITEPTRRSTLNCAIEKINATGLAKVEAVVRAVL